MASTDNITFKHSHPEYLPITGGELKGQITKETTTTTWVAGRLGALLRITTGNKSQYNPIMSLKTADGSWEVAVYNHLTYENKLIFSYVPDSNFNASINTPTPRVMIDSDGTLHAKAFVNDL